MYLARQNTVTIENGCESVGRCLSVKKDSQHEHTDTRQSSVPDISGSEKSENEAESEISSCLYRNPRWSSDDGNDTGVSSFDAVERRSSTPQKCIEEEKPLDLSTLYTLSRSPERAKPQSLSITSTEVGQTALSVADDNLSKISADGYYTAPLPCLKAPDIYDYGIGWTEIGCKHEDDQNSTLSITSNPDTSSADSSLICWNPASASPTTSCTSMDSMFDVALQTLGNIDSIAVPQLR